MRKSYEDIMCERRATEHGKAATVVIDEATETVSIRQNLHPARRSGINAGMMAAGGREPNEELYVQVINAVLTYLLQDESAEVTAEHERSYESLVGFSEGWAMMMAVEPLPLLTRAQTARVQALPRGVRRAWLAEYRRSIKKLQRDGGTLSGKRPVLPGIP